MHKSILEIAEARNISYAEAEEFCRAVYRHFVGIVPKYEVLAQAVNDAPTASPTAIADLIARDRAIVQPTQIKPLRPKQVEPPAWSPTTPPKPIHSEPPPRFLNELPLDRGNQPTFTKARYQRSGKPTPKPREQSGGGRRAYVPPKRVDTESYAPCPHGVPFYKKCHICNPDSYNE